MLPAYVVQEYARRITINLPAQTVAALYDFPNSRPGRGDLGPTRLDLLLDSFRKNSHGRIAHVEDKTTGFHGDECVCVELWSDDKPVKDSDVKRLIAELKGAK